MIHGYARRYVNEEGLLELREVTFSLDSQCLRRVAQFLLSCAEELDAGTFRSEAEVIVSTPVISWPGRGRVE